MAAKDTVHPFLDPEQPAPSMAEVARLFRDTLYAVDPAVAEWFWRGWSREKQPDQAQGSAVAALYKAITRKRAQAVDVTEKKAAARIAKARKDGTAGHSPYLRVIAKDVSAPPNPETFPADLALVDVGIWRQPHSSDTGDRASLYGAHVDLVGDVVAVTGRFVSTDPGRYGLGSVGLKRVHEGTFLPPGWYAMGTDAYRAHLARVVPRIREHLPHAGATVNSDDLALRTGWLVVNRQGLASRYGQPGMDLQQAEYGKPWISPRDFPDVTEVLPKSLDRHHRIALDPSAFEWVLNLRKQYAAEIKERVATARRAYDKAAAEIPGPKRKVADEAQRRFGSRPDSNGLVVIESRSTGVWLRFHIDLGKASVYAPGLSGLIAEFQVTRGYPRPEDRDPEVGYKAAVSGRYLAEGIRAILDCGASGRLLGDPVTIEWFVEHPSAPMVLRSEHGAVEAWHVVMPMRLD